MLDDIPCWPQCGNGPVPTRLDGTPTLCSCCLAGHVWSAIADRCVDCGQTGEQEYARQKVIEARWKRLALWWSNRG